MWSVIKGVPVFLQSSFVADNLKGIYPMTGTGSVHYHLDRKNRSKRVLANLCYEHTNHFSVHRTQAYLQNELILGSTPPFHGQCNCPGAQPSSP
jgi:hypothetical protein